MNRLQNALAKPSTPVQLTRPAGVRRRQYEQFQRFQRSIGNLTNLAASMESIEASGQITRSTNLLFVQQLELLGVKLDAASMENINDDMVIYNAGMEGLGKAISSLMNRFKDWYERRNDDHLRLLNKASELAVNILKTAEPVRAKLGSMDSSSRVTLDLTKFGAWVTTDQDRNPKLDTISKTLRDGRGIAEDCARRAEQTINFNRELIRTLDVSSDAAYEKTFLAKLPTALKFYYQKLPPALASLGNRRVRLRVEFTPENIKTYLAGGDVEGIGFLDDEDRKVDVGTLKTEATVAEVLQMLDACIAFCKEVQGGTYGKRYAKLDNDFYQTAVALFMIEEGEYSEQKRFQPELQKHSYHRRYLQGATGPIWSYIDIGAFDTLLVCAEAARAGTQIARHAVTEAKN